jgi:hypothetical protein
MIRGYLGNIDSTSLNGANLVITYKAYFFGPEVSSWSQGSEPVREEFVPVELVGTETPNQLSAKITDAMVATLLGNTGLTVSKTDLYLPSIVKGQ